MRPFLLQHLERNPTFILECGKGLWHPGCNSRIFPKYPSPLERNTKGPATTQEEPWFSLFISRWGSISLLRWKAILAFSSHLKRRPSQLDTREECKGSFHHSKRPLLLGASTGYPTHDKVMRRDMTWQGESGLKGSSAWASTLKSKSVCLLSAILYSSDITGGYTQPPFSGKS